MKQLGINLNENYIPKALTVPLKVLYESREDDIKETRNLGEDTIIEPAEDLSTELRNHIIFAINTDSTTRYATDFMYFSKQVLRTVHLTT